MTQIIPTEKPFSLTCFDNRYANENLYLPYHSLAARIFYSSRGAHSKQRPYPACPIQQL
jgi:hypothetical protein